MVIPHNSLGSFLSFRIRSDMTLPISSVSNPHRCIILWEGCCFPNRLVLNESFSSHLMLCHIIRHCRYLPKEYLFCLYLPTLCNYILYNFFPQTCCLYIRIRCFCQVGRIFLSGISQAISCRYGLL